MSAESNQVERRAKRFHLEAIHFCRENKVKYRLHLTLGMLLSTTVGMLGTHFNVPWAVNVSLFFNLLTAIIWIWE